MFQLNTPGGGGYGDVMDSEQRTKPDHTTFPVVAAKGGSLATYKMMQESA